MRRYETTFIVNPQADDDAIDRQVAAVVDLIKGDGGNILHEQRIGTRRLAYPIDGLVQGFYASFVFDAENSVLSKLERHYKLEEPYIRYLTILYDGKLPEAEEPAERKPAESRAEEPADKKPVESMAAEPVERKPAESMAAEPAELMDAEQPDKPVLEEKPEADSPAPPIEEIASPEMAVEEPAEKAIVDPKPAEAVEPPAVPPDPTDEEL